MFDEELIQAELSFKAVRSSGAGGQNVNKVASKVELSFNLLESSALSEEQKQRLLISLENRLTKDNVLQLQCDESRSQHKNKTIVIKRFLELIRDGLEVPKERVPTKIPRAVIKKRLKTKRIQSDTKANRKPPKID
jgi:ribosome-associated protein